MQMAGYGQIRAPPGIAVEIDGIVSQQDIESGRIGASDGFFQVLLMENGSAELLIIKFRRLLRNTV